MTEGGDVYPCTYRHIADSPCCTQKLTHCEAVTPKKKTTNFKIKQKDFPGGLMVKNPDTRGSIPSPGRSHMSQGN